MTSLSIAETVAEHFRQSGPKVLSMVKEHLPHLIIMTDNNMKVIQVRVRSDSGLSLLDIFEEIRIKEGGDSFAAVADSFLRDAQTNEIMGEALMVYLSHPEGKRSWELKYERGSDGMVSKFDEEGWVEVDLIQIRA